MDSFTSISGVNRIAVVDDPVIRNYQITQSYHELSAALATRIGPCANWCTFATWASRQAGQTIRGEDLAQALEQHLQATPAIQRLLAGIAERARRKGAKIEEKGIAKLVWETVNPGLATRRASAAVARGNQKVYAEIGREFARFLETCLDDPAYDADHITHFCAPLKPGPPPDGQQYLRQAFTRYYQAFFEPDLKAKTQLILLANLEIGFHEQTRLQPEIAEALEAALEDPAVFKRNLINTLFPGRLWLNHLGPLFSAISGRPTPLDTAINGFSTRVRHRIRLFLTDHLMALGFPKGLWLPLGHDLRAGFPAILKHLTNTDLIDFLKQVDPSPDSLKETGAVDWANLPERLHFIADLFRCYQETAELLGPPFEPELEKAVKAGRLPHVH